MCRLTDDVCWCISLTLLSSQVRLSPSTPSSFGIRWAQTREVPMMMTPTSDTPWPLESSLVTTHPMWPWACREEQIWPAKWVNCSSGELSKSYFFNLSGCPLQLKLDKFAQFDGGSNRRLLRLHYRHLWHQRWWAWWHPYRRPHVDWFHPHGKIWDWASVRSLPG